MNPPSNRFSIFGFLQNLSWPLRNGAAESEGEPANPPSMPSSQLVSTTCPTVPALRLNDRSGSRLLVSRVGDGMRQTLHAAPALEPNVPLGPRLPSVWDPEPVPAPTNGSRLPNETHNPQRRAGRHRHALRGDPSDDEDFSDCSTTAVHGTGVRRSLRRDPVRYWPYQEAQRQNRNALHRNRSHNYSTTAQAGSPPQSFDGPGFAILFAHEPGYSGVLDEPVTGPSRLRAPLTFGPPPAYSIDVPQRAEWLLSLHTHVRAQDIFRTPETNDRLVFGNPIQAAVDAPNDRAPINAIAATPRELASTARPVAEITVRVFADASVQTSDSDGSGTSPISSNASHELPSSNTQPSTGDNRRKRSREEDDSQQAEGPSRPLARKRTCLGIGLVPPPAPLRRSTRSTNI